MVGTFDDFDYFFIRHRYIDCDHIVLHGHDIRNEGIGKVKRRAEHIALLFVHDALFLRRVYDVIEVVLGYRRLILAGKELRHELRDSREHGDEREEYLHKHFQREGILECESLAPVVCVALRDHLGKEENEEGRNDRSVKEGCGILRYVAERTLFPEFKHERCGNGTRAYVRDVVADKHG